MARILAISSQVARGAVGLSIIVPALQALGHEVIALPTVILSNHPGHTHVAGQRFEPATLRRILDALDANGWLAGVEGVLTGYLPSVDHVAFAIEAVRRINPRLVLCDPVLGDDPKGLYLDAAAAAAIRDQLIPLAHIATPNRFELSFLLSSSTVVPIGSAADVIDNRLNGPATLATSIPSHTPGELTNVLAMPQSNAMTRVPLRRDAPHGTGDLLSALALSELLETADCRRALAFATAGVDAALAGSAGQDQLKITALPTRTTMPMPWPVETI
jgi:pyridoxine kinase